MQQAKEKDQRYLIVVNKVDEVKANQEFLDNKKEQIVKEFGVEKDAIYFVSARNHTGIHGLKEQIAQRAPKEKEQPLVRDLLKQNDVVVLVVPIDSAAPKGRLILPQQQVIRDVLEAGAIPVVTKETQLLETLDALKVKPRMVITDSQAFGVVAKQLS